MTDVNDEKQVKRGKKALWRRRDEEIAQLKTVLNTYGGRAVIYRLLDECKLLSIAPYAGSIERFEGRRDVGIWAMNEIFTSNPNAYNIMRREAVSRDTKEKEQSDG